MKHLPYLIACLTTTLLLTACGQGDTARDSSAEAVLDYENNLILKPLDEYNLTSQAGDIYNKVHTIETTRCTTALGTPFTYPDNTVEIGSREYGFWNPSYIENNGYLIFSLGVDEENLEAPPETSLNIETCVNTDPELIKLTEKLDAVGKDVEITERLRTEAHSLAAQSPEWQKARETWWACLEGQGLTPRTDDVAWTSEQLISANTSTPEGREEKVRIALTEANCSQQTGMAQTLADLEASYQAPLVRENQAALNQAKAAVQEFTSDMEQRYLNNQ